MATINPFIVNGAIPDEYFCDRVEESKQLINNLINGRNTVLSSSRRVGKTGLIEHCFHDTGIVNNYYTFFFDILQTTSLREFVYLFGNTLFETLKPRSRKMLDTFVQTVRSLSGEFGYDPITNLPKFSISLGAIQNPEYTLDEIFRYIDLADKPCLIAIDEFQQIVRYPEKNVEAILRTHIQHCSNAVFVYAGSERHILAEMFNSYSRPFYASTTMMSLKVLNKDIYSEFVCRHFRDNNKNIEPAVVESVYDLFDGNTYCMQRTFNVTFEMTEVNQSCDKKDCLSAINRIIDEHDHSFRMRLSQLTQKPKELLYAIAKETHAQNLTSGAFIRRHQLSSASSVQSAVKQLLSEDWITYTIEGKNRIFTVADGFLRLWILKNYSAGFHLD